ncbi:MAG: hypothetical protein WC650_05860 [Candidatus Doudnabacteria bacterium]
MGIGVRRRGWLELALLLAISATITIIGFVQKKNIAWRILSFPVGILFAFYIAYWAPNSAIKIEKANHNRKIRKVVEARSHQLPL